MMRSLNDNQLSSMNFNIDMAKVTRAVKIKPRAISMVQKTVLATMR